MGIVAIGQSVTRDEDPVLLTGRGQYNGDINLPNMAYGYVLRSPHARAKIKSIDTSAAAAMEGVAAVLTGDDLMADKIGKMPLVVPPIPGLDIETVHRPARYGLAVGEVRVVGDPVAFIVADSLLIAKDAAELVEVDYEVLDPVTDALTSKDGSTVTVWEDRPGNIAFEKDFGDKEATDAAFAAAAHVVRHEMVVNRVAVSSMEPRGTTADFDPKTGHTTVYIGTQGVFGMRKTLAEQIFNDKEENFRVVTGHMGGSFGMKNTYPENILTIWASRRLGRPVKWENDRQESLLSDYQGRGKQALAELALDADGKFLAIRADIVANLGAYLSPLAFMHTMLSIGGLTGVYNFPTAFHKITGVFTNTGSTNPYRGSNRPDTAYILERMIDIAAEQTGIDRFELRRRNIIPSAIMPHKTPLGPVYDCGEFEKNMDDALSKIDFAGFAARKEASAKAGKLRGFGLANNVEAAGGVGQEFADIAFAEDGSATISVGTTDNGQGHAAMYKIVVCDRLGIDPDRVRVIEGDSDALAQGNGTGGSRVSSYGSSAALAAADGLVEKGRKIAAHILEAGLSDIEFDDGRFVVAGTDKEVSIDEVIKVAFQPDQLPPDMEAGFAEEGVFTGKAPNYPNGCHVCEVEVDPDTGGVDLVRYVAVSDVGTIINRLTLDGQIHGGIGQGAGQVLMEGLQYDENSGQLLTGSFLDYAMPRASDFPAFELADNPTFTEANPLGVKVAGEVGTACAMPAVVNAVVDALKDHGVAHIDMPLSAEKVWAAMHQPRH